MRAVHAGHDLVCSMAHMVNKALCALFGRRDAHTCTGADVVTSRSHATHVLPEQRGHGINDMAPADEACLGR